MLLTENFVLGMPQLTYGGLSENLLLKTCGEYHWRVVCSAIGQHSHRIADARGNRLYASFVELLHHGAPLSDFGENDKVALSVDVRRLSARRVWSRQTLAAPETGAELTMEMLTLFMKRGKSATSNVGLEATDPSMRIDMAGFDPEVDQSEIINKRTRLYDQLDEPDFAGLDEAYRSMNTYEYTPCPTVDFNGALASSLKSGPT